MGEGLSSRDSRMVRTAERVWDEQLGRASAWMQAPTILQQHALSQSGSTSGGLRWHGEEQLGRASACMQAPAILQQHLASQKENTLSELCYMEYLTGIKDFAPRLELRMSASAPFGCCRGVRQLSMHDEVER